MTSKSKDENAASHPIDEASAKESEALADPTWKPTCIYLFRLINPRNNHADVEVYFYDHKGELEDTAVDGIVRAIIEKIPSGTVYPVGWAFGDLRMRRRSYVVVAVDDEDATLDKSGIRFIFVDDHMTADHTFKKERNIRPFDYVTGVMYWNHIWKKSSAWGLHPEEFEVDIRFGSRKGAAGPRTHEDTATNLGPPRV